MVPGPATTPTPAKAICGAADWIWVYAEASESLRRPGRGAEWTTYIFADASTKLYGFTTPESHGEVHATTTDVPAIKKKLAGRIGTVVGSMHSHPRGRPTAAGLAEAMERDDAGMRPSQLLWETMTDSENFSPGDRVDAYHSPAVWNILLTPNGAVKAIKVKGEAKSRFERQKAAALARGEAVDRFGFLAKVLRDDTLFHTWLVRAAVAAFWHPPRDWYKPRVEYVKREMSHSH